MSVTLHQALRSGLLAASGNLALASWVRRHGALLGARRFVAGETLDECVRVLRRLRDEGFSTTTTLLGEAVTSEQAARGAAAEYAAVLRRLADEDTRTTVALKLTHLGLDVSEALAYETVSHVVRCAAALGNFVRIDMEQSSKVDPTLRLYRRLRSEGLTNVGVVLQACLYRSDADLRALLPLRPNVRLVKGAYLEPREIAFPRKRDVDRSFVRLIALALSGEGYTAVATHDERVIERTLEVARADGIDFDRVEF
ncbi:MAG TPA: proline dehydrogenase family protein, partial [bacterium]|nr:proline dehydrogenase family protein [bacterium]